jgi:hypothetical protein
MRDWGRTWTQSKRKLQLCRQNNSHARGKLATACTQEISHRRELIPETDEREALRKWHVRELLELEAEARQRERELHDVDADLTTAREDLERERKTATLLKEALAQQGAAQKSLQSRNSALQAQLATLRVANDGTSETVSTRNGPTPHR